MLRLLGDDLVAFRDSEGRLGVVDAHCPHRRDSTALGRDEESGLRRLYHGWKVDVAGNVVDMPSELRESCLAQEIRHRAYARREAGGFVRVWMGRPMRRANLSPRPGPRPRHTHQHGQDARGTQLGAGADAARTVCHGGAAIGTSPAHVPHVKLQSFEGIVPKATNWKTLASATKSLR